MKQRKMDSQQMAHKKHMKRINPQMNKMGLPAIPPIAYNDPDNDMQDSDDGVSGDGDEMGAGVGSPAPF